MASLYKRNGWYYLSFCRTGQQPRIKQVALKISNKRAALRRARLLEAQYEAGTFDPWKPLATAPPLSRLEDAVTAFLQSRSNLSPQTVAKYRSVLGLLVAFLGADTATDAITTAQIHAFLHSSPKEAITRRTYTTTMSPFFNWLITAGAIDVNPTTNLRLERVPQKFPRFLTPDDVEAIIGAIITAKDGAKITPGTSQWLIPIVRSNVYLGLRAGELVNLRWDDVAIDKCLLSVNNIDGFTTKSGKGRVLPLCTPVLRVLEGLERCEGYVFPSHTGRQLGRQYLSRRFKHFARQAGLNDEINFHSTRHTAASWLAQAGCSIEAIRQYMGHSSIAVTQKYMHLSPSIFAQQIETAFTLPGRVQMSPSQHC